LFAHGTKFSGKLTFLIFLFFELQLWVFLNFYFLCIIWKFNPFLIFHRRKFENPPIGSKDIADFPKSVPTILSGFCVLYKIFVRFDGSLLQYSKFLWIFTDIEWKIGYIFWTNWGIFKISSMKYQKWIEFSNYVKKNKNLWKPRAVSRKIGKVNFPENLVRCTTKFFFIDLAN